VNGQGTEFTIPWRFPAALSRVSPA
jgi:hypothetical protein